MHLENSITYKEILKMIYTVQNLVYPLRLIILQRAYNQNNLLAI